ncbi:MAG: holin [Candidatus Dormibacteria bacterium]
MFSSLSKQFWLQSAERAVKTFAQTLIGALPPAYIAIGSLGAVLAPALVAATLAAIVSLAISVCSEPWGDRQSPSVVPSAPVAPKARKRSGRSRRLPATSRRQAGAAGAA